MKSLNAMVRQICALAGTKDVTKWENDFICSIGRRTGVGEHTQGLTDKQIEVVERIYSRHFGDADA